jgi:hypothetical protein
VGQPADMEQQIRSIIAPFVLNPNVILLAVGR